MKIERAVSVMSGFGRHWGMAGGWAIDVFLTRQTRPHADLDVAVLRDDQRDLRSCLGDAHVQKVVAHELTDWPADEVLEQPIHEVHATWPDGYHLEFLLNEQDHQTHECVFRRDARIRLPLAAAFRAGQGVPYLTPEIVLLYKSKAPAAKDEADFNEAMPHLSAEQRAWLRDALTLTSPAHRWLLHL